MFPIIKSLKSITKAKLIPTILISCVLAVITVSSAAGIITWISASFISIKIVWLDKAVNFLIGIASGVGGWFMLPAVIPFIAGMFQDKVIHNVEIEFYPDSVRKKEPELWPDLKHDIAFTIWALFLNILILPLYLFGIGFFISILLNTYLLGREFFENVAGSHLGKPEAKKLGNKNRIPVYTGGLVITLLTLIPVVNLFIPVFAVVWMVHVFHRIKT